MGFCVVKYFSVSKKKKKKGSVNASLKKIPFSVPKKIFFDTPVKMSLVIRNHLCINFRKIVE